MNARKPRHSRGKVKPSGNSGEVREAGGQRADSGEGQIVKRAIVIAVCSAAFASPVMAADAVAPAQKYIEAQYSAKKMAPFIEQRVEARVTSPQDVDRVIKAVRAQLPEFYSASALAVAPLFPSDQMAKVAEFAASQTGRRLAMADLRWAEEVRDQAEVCLEDGADRLRSVAADRARAVGVAARLVLGDCTVMREAKKELGRAIDKGNLARARVYVDAGGVSAETIQALAAPAAEAAAKALIAAKVAPAKDSKALAAAVLKAVASETVHWKDAAALHYAAAFRQDDLKRLAAFVTSDAGSEFLTAKPKIDATVAAAADAWFTGSVRAAISANGALAAGAAAAAGMPAIGPLPQPQLAIKPRSAPVIVMKPAT